jgi:hypothetical protein
MTLTPDQITRFVAVRRNAVQGVKQPEWTTPPHPGLVSLDRRDLPDLDHAPVPEAHQPPARPAPDAGAWLRLARARGLRHRLAATTSAPDRMTQRGAGAIGSPCSDWLPEARNATNGRSPRAAHAASSDDCSRIMSVFVTFTGSGERWRRQ